MASNNRSTAIVEFFKAIALLMLGLVLWFFSTLLRPSKHTAAMNPTPTVTAQPGWDGIEGHPDCTKDGHPSPTERGVTISDEYTDACQTVPSTGSPAKPEKISPAHEIPTDIRGLVFDVMSDGELIKREVLRRNVSGHQAFALSRQFSQITSEIESAKISGDFTVARRDLVALRDREDTIIRNLPQ